MSGAMNLTDYIASKGGTATIQCAVLKALATKAGCSDGTLYMISKGHKSAGPKLANAIEKATDGAVSRHDLRPDVFGPAQAALDSAA